MDQREEKQVQSKGEGEGMQTPHKRRVRYKGTHPRSYQEKYKELNPEKYKDTVDCGEGMAKLLLWTYWEDLYDYWKMRSGGLARI